MMFQAVRYQVSFWNGSVPLQGDLVIPPGPGPHPAVVLVNGTSGPRDRGRWIDAVAHCGMATLTWDSPGWGGSEGGPRAWQAPDQRTMEVLAAVDFLRDVRDVSATGVGVIGSDLGCWAAALAAGLSSRVASLVLLSPPAVGGMWQELHRLGQRLRAGGFITAEIGLAQLVLRERIRRLAAGQDGATILAAEAACRHAPWYGWLPGTTVAEIEAFGTVASYDPGGLLGPVRCPVLAVFGADDTESPAWEGAETVRRALASAAPRDHQVVVLPRTDDALRPVWAADGAGPRAPGDWHPDLVGYITDWLAPRIGRLRQAETVPPQT